MQFAIIHARSLDTPITQNMYIVYRLLNKIDALKLVWTALRHALYICRDVSHTQ